ncbi:MAG: MGMT family protein [Chloroflexi bacterium]|nr:MGMT family protein [Chloroflexota bacterium]
MSHGSDFRTGIERRFGGPITWIRRSDRNTTVLASRSHLEATVEALLAALRGDAADLSALTLDLTDRPTWDQAVLGAVRGIPRSETRSYADIARAIGRHGAARAVGGAVGRNPVGYVIPCHRVIASDGTLGGYGGGWWGDRDRLLILKEELLAREGLIVRRSVPGTSRGR